MRIRDLFEACLVINLHRRADRWAAVSLGLQSVGSTPPVRIEAVDGQSGDVVQQYQRYLRDAAWVSDSSEILNDRDHYTGGHRHAARAAYAARTSGRPPIASSAAFAYLLSYRSALSAAIASGADPVLVLDDDCRFHRATSTLLDYIDLQLPEDWLVIQLGTMQYNWGPRWINRVSRNLYRNNGATVGTHAVGYRRSILGQLIERIEASLMPFDIGPFSDFVQENKSKCFVAYPNIAIQDILESDINTSQHSNIGTEEISRMFRWKFGDYIV